MGTKVQDELERAMEKEMVQMLFEKNKDSRSKIGHDATASSAAAHGKSRKRSCAGPFPEWTYLQKVYETTGFQGQCNMVV